MDPAQVWKPLSTTASATASPQNQPLSLGGASSSSPSSAGATEHLFSTQDHRRLNQLHSYLIGQPTSESTSPPVLHALLEVQQAAIIKQFQQIQADFELRLTQTLQDTIKDTVTAALHSQTPPSVPRVYHKIPDTPRISLDTGRARTKLGSVDHSESSGKCVKIESPTSGTHLSGTGTSLSLSGCSTQPQDLFSPGQTLIPSPPSTSIPLPQPAETEEEGEQWKMEQFAELVGRAFSAPLQEAIRSVSQTPGPAASRSKIPAPEKYDGKKGPGAKSFILDCKTYFLSNPGSFPSDHSCISYVPMSLKVGIPKQWGQYYLKKLIDGDPDPLLENWNTFEQGFLSNWTDPASVQVAERWLHALNQSHSAQEYATEFCIIASELELGENTLMSEICQGLKRDVKTELIKFSMGRNISTLDELISTACLIDNTLFEACRESQGPSPTATMTQRGSGTRSGDFMTREIQEKCRKAGKCVKCGGNNHKFEDCRSGWKLQPGEKIQPETGKLGDLISLETPVESGKA
jgi:hypothetical protein